MKNSIIQIIRVPSRLIILIISMVISTALLVYSISLLATSNIQLNQLEGAYTTIGTIQQNKTSTVVESIYNATTKTYSHYKFPIYDSYISKDILNLLDFPYLVAPEKRAYYGAYVENYQTKNETFENVSAYELMSIIEFTPAESCIPNQPVLVNVTDVLMGNNTLKNTNIAFCDHNTEYPGNLEKGKKYIATVMMQDNSHSQTNSLYTQEWYPTKILPYTSQCDKKGEVVDNDINLTQGLSWEEVTDNFYENGRGKYWLNMIESYQILKKTIPVLSTNSMNLLPSFHEKEAYIIEGNVSDNDFEKGNRVCVISKQFAETNELSVGGKINLPLYFANYNEPSSVAFGQGAGLDFSLLNKDGDLYPVFSNHDYEIVGIYEYQNTKGDTMAGSTEMAFDQVIIPVKSIYESDENNIVSVGPMLNTTTSFQIKNGTMNEFMQEFKKLDQSDLLTLDLDDNGYEQIKTELMESRVSSYIFGFVGGGSMISVIMMIIYFYIVKEKKKIAIERSLGMSKKQCKVSLLSGLMSVIFLATILGGIVSGVVMISQIKLVSQTQFYNLDYSINVLDINKKSLNDAASTIIHLNSILLPLFIVLIIFIISNCTINKLINRSIIETLGDREE